MAALGLGRLAVVRGRRRAGRARARLDHLHRRAVAQLVGAVDDHALARVQAPRDRDAVALGHAQRDGAQRDVAVGADHVDEGALRAALDGRARQDHLVVQRVDAHAHVDELVGEQRRVLVGELRAQLDGAGGVVDGVVHRHQRAVGEQVGLAAVPGLHRQLVAGLQPGHHLGQGVFGQGVDDGDRVDLRDDDDAGGVRRVDDVARVHLAQADAARHRRCDARVRQLHPGVVGVALVELDRALVLAHQRGLRVHLLLGDGVLRHQGLVALQIQPGVLQQRGVARELALGLGELGLVGAGVDLGQQVAGLDGLALGEGQAHELAVDTCLDGHVVDRGDVAQRGQHDIDIALARGGDHDRHRLAARHRGAAAARAALAGGGAAVHRVKDRIADQHQDGQHHPEDPAARLAGAGRGQQRR